MELLKLTSANIWILLNEMYPGFHQIPGVLKTQKAVSPGARLACC